MYINTLSKKEIIKSLCNMFNMSEIHLKDTIKYIKRLDYDEQEQEINKLIKKCLNKPTELLFFHLSRRLNTMILEYDGKPLSNLLTTTNDFSNFLKKYKLTFNIDNNKNIILNYNNKIIELNNKLDSTSLYINSRLKSDKCFDGQAFNITITDSIYNYSLKESPEIIENLSILINNPKMIDDYSDKSTYYCYIYKVPLDIVFVCGEKDNNIKIYKLIDKCFDIIYFNQKEENLLLRLEDDYILPSKYFLDKFEIEKM